MEKFLLLAHEDKQASAGLPQCKKLYKVADIEDYAQAPKPNDSFLCLLSSNLSSKSCFTIHLISNLLRP